MVEWVRSVICPAHLSHKFGLRNPRFPTCTSQHPVLFEVAADFERMPASSLRAVHTFSQIAEERTNGNDSVRYGSEKKTKGNISVSDVSTEFLQSRWRAY